MWTEDALFRNHNNNSTHDIMLQVVYIEHLIVTFLKGFSFCQSVFRTAYMYINANFNKIGQPPSFDLGKLIAI